MNMVNKTTFAVGSLLLLLAPLIAAAQTATVETKRPATWAEPVTGQSDLPNLHRVDDSLFRGAQPDDKGYPALKKMGIKTVVNLRAFHSDEEQCQANALTYVNIPIKTWDTEPEEIVAFLKVMQDPEQQPVFVHCLHGADRTGMMCAFYRIVVQDWSKEEAINEMRNGGYNFHEMWHNIVRRIEKADIDKIKKALQ